MLSKPLLMFDFGSFDDFKVFGSFPYYIDEGWIVLQQTGQICKYYDMTLRVASAPVANEYDLKLVLYGAELNDTGMEELASAYIEMRDYGAFALRQEKPVIFNTREIAILSVINSWIALYCTI